MNILGISCYFHDAAVALLMDGVVVAAAAEERFTRVKHDQGFPHLAIEYCLKEGGLNAADLDYVVFYEKPLVKFDRILTSAITTWPLSYRTFLRAIPIWLKQRIRVGREIEKALGREREILFTQHHLSHAAAAFLASPYERAGVLTIDGVGEWSCAAMGFGEGNQVVLEREIRFPHSLGLLYSAITAYLGFQVNDSEWKVMGLASYGKPRFRQQLEQLVQLYEDGSFRLDMRYFTFHHHPTRMINRAFCDLFGHAVRAPESELTEFHQDVAHSAQEMVERVVLNMARATAARYQTDTLCIAGGVGLNCVANWKILEQTPIRELFVQPAAGDDGGAIGAAYYVYNTLLDQPRQAPMGIPFFGPAFSDEEIRGALDESGLPFEVLSPQDLIATVAREIVEEKVVGWYQGRMEYGPRALGNRSILASPCKAEMKDVLNAKIKFREYFRPFAPAVLQDRAHEYFELGHVSDAPYMLLAPQVVEAKKTEIPAVTHADGTGRVQTVRREENPLYYDLIAKVGELSGVPVVVNTSFNIRGEPIVCTPREAINCFLGTGIDVLVMGDTITRKSRAGGSAAGATRESGSDQ